MTTIKSFKKFIEESIWSDIQDRSSGDTVRKEDDINTLDLNEFYAYIKDQYKTKVEYIDLDVTGGENGDFLNVDITENVILFYNPKRGHILLSWSRVKIPPMPFLDELTDRFKVENPNAMRKIITEKDGSCTNKTFVDVIEFFLGHKGTIMNESIWSDIQDRSSGDTVRKEDERHIYLERLLATYIKLFAEGCYSHDEYTYCSYPDFRSYIKDFRDNPRIEEVCPNDSYFDDLLDYVNKETWDNQIFDTVMEISQRIVKGEHPITDDVIEELKKHNVNESIWSDIQDRSAGDTVRKEDEYDIDEKELERSVDICIKTYVRCSVYYDKYDGSSDTFLKCIQEWNRNICQNAQLYDRRFGKYVEPIKVIPSYVKKNWETGKSYKSLVEKKMSEEEKKVKDTGFIKKSGESISDTLSKWFDENFEKLGDDFCEEIEEYNERYHNEGGSMSVDLDVDDWWDNLEYIEQVEIYQDYMKKTNESIWSDIQDRSAGDTVRKEDLITTNGDLRKKIQELYKEQGKGETLDVSSLTNRIKCDDFSDLFQGYDRVKHIIGIEDWDVSKVTNMNSMFWGCKNFNSDLSNWDVSSVKDMGYMFWRCEKFNCDLSKWDVSNVKHMYGMFVNCTNFNSDLSKWNVRSVKNMYNMFDGCDSLKMKPSWYMKKLSKITESIWSDIQDRSSGDTVRQEDISEEDKKEIDYIFNGFAYLIVFTYYEPTIDDFIKMMKEAHPDKDNSKYIAWVKSNWDKKYKDELDKKIQYYKTYIDKKINRYLNHFVAQIVYCEKYNVSLIDIKKFADEVYKNGGMPLEMSSVGEIDVNESWYDIFKKYVDENWNDVKKRINDFIVEENQKIAKTGFKKTPGKKICDILDEWWYSLGDEKEDIAWDEFGERAEDKYYEEHDPEYNEYTGEDFEADDEWANASWIESVEIYMKYNQKTNESIWSDIQDRSSGDTVRKEDEMTQDDFDAVDDFIFGFATRVVWYGMKYSLSNFLKYIDENPDTLDCDIERVKKYVEDNWHKGICDDVEAAIEQEEKERERDINESIWSDIQDRSSGDTVRQEDMITTNKDLRKKILELYKEQGEGETLDVSSLTNAIKCDDFSSIFRGFYKVKYIIGLEDWDVSKVTNMKKMFYNCYNFNSDLSNWDVSSVKDMRYMFWCCINFNSDLSNWDVSNVEDMYSMFQNCKKFNSDLSKWNVSDVKNMYSMFDGCDSLKMKPSWYMKYNQKTNESIWSDIQDRSAGDTVRKEDEMTYDDFIMLRATAKMFRVGVRNYSNPKKHKYTLKRIDGCDGFIDYILEKKKEHFWNDTPDETYDKAINFVKNNWGDCTGIQEFIDKCLNNINECDGVPGGLTPADVGGMGPAYFPGPNGEPGSGDLPSPTGIVYKQVAPFDTFIKIRKQKKKKKKFRKEDEPCAHSKNPKIYNYVDDFRDYVDRTYNNIDKRK